MNNLGLLLQDQKKYSDAEGMHRETLKLHRKVLGQEHPITLLSMGNLALTLSYEKKYNEAEKVTRENLALKEKVLGREHPSTLTALGNLEFVLESQGKYSDAEAMHREALARKEETLGQNHPSTLGTRNAVTRLHNRKGIQQGPMANTSPSGNLEYGPSGSEDFRGIERVVIRGQEKNTNVHGEQEQLLPAT
jgi:tetratricopeptide (TPR) repeat protein